MNRRKSPIFHGFFRLALLGLALFSFLPHSRAEAAGHQILKGHVPEAVSTAPLVGPLEDTTKFHLAIGLPPQNQADLENLLKDLYDPRSTLYRKFLTPEEYAMRFGPSESDYQAVADFFRLMGMRVDRTYPNRLLMDVSGTAGDIRRVFHVQMNKYRRPDGSLFQASDSEPSLDLDISIQHVSGLDNFNRVYPKMRKLTRSFRKYAGGLGAKNGSVQVGVTQLYRGKDLRDSYVPNLPASVNGAGQSVGLLEYDGWYASDLTYYETHWSPAITAPAPITYVADTYNSFNGTPIYALDTDEVSLDIEMVVSMAPGAQVVVYEASPDDPSLSASANDILAAMATTLRCNQVSSSWGGYGDTTTTNLMNQLASQGQAYFEASGDYGAYVRGDPTPSIAAAGDPSLYTSQFETLVGGTALSTTNPAGTPASISYISEKTWNDSIGASGGGSCTNLMNIPSYQAPVPMTTNGGSTQWRNLPDVSAAAASLLLVSENYSTTGKAVSYLGLIDGTSASSPLWAAFWSLANQQASASGKGPVGSANPPFIPWLSHRPRTQMIFMISTTGAIIITRFPDPIRLLPATTWPQVGEALTGKI